jgi:Cu+-exporting ATPase
VLAAAREQGVAIGAVQDAHAVPGQGSEGVVDGVRVQVGSARWMRELGVDLKPFDAAAGMQQAQGATISILSVQPDAAQPPQALALLAFGDEPKPGARGHRAPAGGGRAHGDDLGDNRGAAEAMARRLGLRPEEGEVLAEVLPGDKAEAVRALKQGVPSLVPPHRGDGGRWRERRPALAAADVGMAMGSGTDVAMHAAGITLMRGDPGWWRRRWTCRTARWPRSGRTCSGPSSTTPPAFRWRRWATSTRCWPARRWRCPRSA